MRKVCFFSEVQNPKVQTRAQSDNNTVIEKLTLGEAWRVVVDVGELDGDGGGPGESPQVAPHVLGLEEHQVLVLGLPVHVRHGRAENTCESDEAFRRRNNRRLNPQVCANEGSKGSARGLGVNTWHPGRGEFRITHARVSPAPVDFLHVTSDARG